VGRLVDAILGLGGPLAYLVVGSLAFGEAAAFIGLVLPGEVAVLLGGVLASEGRVRCPS
jgi:membrane protein DedA with SNARE-associated domain